MPYLYTPNEITCNRCLQIIPISSIHIHNPNCEKRIPKSTLGTIIEEISTHDSRYRCKHCKRLFASERIEKHQSACEFSSKKRPLFEIVKKRVPNLYETIQKPPSKKGSLNLVYPNSKWQKQHLELIRNLRLEEDDSNYEDYIACPYCFRRFAPFSADKHIEICKNILNKPKPPPVTNRFPQIQNLEKKLSIRANSLNSLWRPNSVYNRNFEKPDRDLSSSSIEEHAGSNTFHLAMSPIKTPILKEELIDPNVKIGKKELATQICPVCCKRFVSSVYDKHFVSCRALQLKPSATLQDLNRQDRQIKYTRKNQNSAFASKQRSNSTHRILTTGVCMNCSAFFPKAAKFCMMCGSIRI